MKTFLRFLVVVLSFVTLASAADVDESVVAKIVIKTNGELLFDGQKVEVRELARLLTPIQEKRGVVWCRAVPRGEKPRDSNRHAVGSAPATVMAQLWVIIYLTQ